MGNRSFTSGKVGIRSNTHVARVCTASHSIMMTIYSVRMTSAGDACSYGEKCYSSKILVLQNTLIAFRHPSFPYQNNAAFPTPVCQLLCCTNVHCSLCSCFVCIKHQWTNRLRIEVDAVCSVDASGILFRS